MADTQAPQTQSAPSDGIWVPALKEAGAAFVAAAVLLTIFYVFAFRWIHPEFVPFMDREATKLLAPGKDLIPVSVGGYRVEGNSAIIEDFNGEEAILALPRSFQAEDYPFIKVNLSGFTRYSKFKILWRRADDLSQTHALEFNRSGDGATQIAMVYGNENYRGQIADIALLFYDGSEVGFQNNNGVDITLESIDFRAFSGLNVAEQIYEDWSNPLALGHHSSNVVRGLHKLGMVYPNAVACLLVAIGCVAALLRRMPAIRRQEKTTSPPLLAIAIALCFYGWLFTESLRWNHRLAGVWNAHQRYASLTLEERIERSELRCSRFPEDCKKELLPYF